MTSIPVQYHPEKLFLFRTVKRLGINMYFTHKTCVDHIKDETMGVYIFASAASIYDAYKPEVYIGKTTNFLKRIVDHKQKNKVNDWTILCTSEDFNESHITALEFELIKKFEHQNVTITNGNMPNGNGTDVSIYLKQILQILETQGFYRPNNTITQHSAYKIPTETYVPVTPTYISQQMYSNTTTQEAINFHYKHDPMGSCYVDKKKRVTVIKKTNKEWEIQIGSIIKKPHRRPNYTDKKYNEMMDMFYSIQKNLQETPDGFIVHNAFVVSNVSAVVIFTIGGEGGFMDTFSKIH
jgi:predicted GIY-YIG superfamily endonuclease